ncbi:TrkH family potassium uptake protein [soil metagenome]
MIDLRPVGYVIGWIVATLGATSVLPLAADYVSGSGNAPVFATSGLLTLVAGALMVLACASRQRPGVTIQQSFLLATGLWMVFPFFGALPFVLGAPRASFTDAFFEAMSALTTTGSTVFVGLEAMPPGVLLWRGMLQWFGGLGIVVVAIVFLPALKVGGMQLFRSEAFDTLGKILPKAGEIALSLTSIYVALTFACMIGYLWTGLNGFDALVHAMTTIATGGMSNYDTSFAEFAMGTHYVASAFMFLAALPFVRYVQFVAGDPRPLWRDTQIQAFFAILGGFVVILSAYLAMREEGPFEPAFREVLFNVVSICTGTGYSSADYGGWGPFAVTMFFVIGLIGGCSGSTTCSVKVFRYQILLAAIAAEVRRLHSPNRVVATRYAGRPVPSDVMNAVIAFFMFFYLTLGVVAVVLVLLGNTPITAISGAATALANIGPGLGPEIGPAGNFLGLSDATKWVLAVTMLVGRLELLTVYVLLSAAVWRG